MSDHPSYGRYNDLRARPNGAIDLDCVRSHPASQDTWSIDQHHGATGWRIISAARPDLALIVAERSDAAFVVDLLNIAVSQLADDDEASGAVTPTSRTVLLRARLALKRDELAQLERDAHDSPAGRSPNAGVSGAAERQRHDALTQEINTLERAIAAEGADGAA